MKLAFFDDFRLGVVNGDVVVDVSSAVQDIPRTGPHDPRARIASASSVGANGRPSVLRTLAGARRRCAGRSSDMRPEHLV